MVEETPQAMSVKVDNAGESVNGETQAGGAGAKPTDSPAAANAAPQPDPNAAPDAVSIEQAWRTFGLVNDWVRFLDGKATAVLAADAALAGVLYAVLKDGIDFLHTHGGLYFPLALTTGALLISIFLALYCVTPKLFPRSPAPATLLQVWGAPFDSSADKTSVLFFEHIAARNWAREETTYSAEARQIFADPKALFAQLSEQIFANSVVARGKAVAVGRSIQFMVWALVLGAVSEIAYLCSSPK